MKLPLVLFGLLALGGAAMCGSLAALVLAAPPPAPVVAPTPAAPADGWPLVPLLGLGAGALLLLQRRAEKHDDHAVAMRQAAHPPAPTAHILHWHAAEPGRLPAAPLAPGPEPPALPAALPGITTLGAVLSTGWRPSAQSILLALGPGGRLLTAPVGDDLCHIILCGATGAGKTNLLRLLLVQLLAAGCEVWLLTSKYTARHWRTGEEWHQLAAGTKPGRAITDFAEICATIRRIHAEEMPARKARFAGGQVPGTVLFLVIDELPALILFDKTIMDPLGDLLRQGRELLIEIILAAQDVLVDTLGGTGGDRSQLQTRYYGGGDDTSKRVLMQLNSKSPLPEPPGRGVVYLRAVATANRPELVRVPLVTNADILALLPGKNGYANGYPSVTAEAARIHAIDDAPTVVDFVQYRAATTTTTMPYATTSPPKVVVDAADPAVVARRAQIRDLLHAKASNTAIINEVWGNPKGRDFMTASRELTGIIADLIP